ncbi:MAG: hypothetical protein H9802_02525 [Candidatus Phocaeicola faecipullorum]|nr:hypothetical protein [Candidatus Phocaeicola faecipullorum]
MASNEQTAVLNIEVNYANGIKAIAQYKTQIDALKKAEKEYKKQLDEGKITQQEYNEAIAKSKMEITELKEKSQLMEKQLKNQVKIQKEQEGSLKQLRAELSNLTAAYDAMSQAERDGAKGTALKKKINDVTDALKEAEEGTQRYYRNVGNYEDSIKSVLGINNRFAESLIEIGQSGKGVNGAFTEMKTSATAFGKTLLGLLSNPVFMAIAAIGGAGVAFKGWYDYNKGIEEANRLTQQFTGATGDELKALRSDVTVLAETFDKDFREVLISTNALSKQFGISLSQATELIKDGFVAGADASGQFLDILKEYPTFFREAGISAEGFVAIATQTAQQGIYSDKGVDTIKEATIRLREMTDATKEALDGIGLSGDEIKEQLTSGSKTMFEVIQQVSTQLNKLPETSSEVGTALADIFGGPGEDAGIKFIKTLKDIDLNLNNVKKTMGTYAQAQEDMVEAQANLDREISRLLDSTENGFYRFVQNVKASWKQMNADLLQWFREMIEGVDDMLNRTASEAAAEGAEAASERILVQYERINNARKIYEELGLSADEALNKSREERVNILKRTLEIEQQNLADAEATVKKHNEEMENASFWRQGLGLDRTNNQIKEDLENAIQVRASAIAAVTSLQKQIEQVMTYNPLVIPEAEDSLEKAEEDAEKAKRLAEQQAAYAVAMKQKEKEEIRKAEDELLKLITDERERQRQQVEVSYERQIEDLRTRLQTEKDLTVEAQSAINTQIVALEQQKQMELQTMKQEDLETEIERRQEEFETLLEQEQEQIQVRFETLLEQNIGNEQARLEIELQQKKAELDALQKLEGESQEAFNLRKLKAQNAYNAQKKKLNDYEVQMEQAKLSAMSQITGALSGLFDALGGENEAFVGLSKMLALAEIAINTGTAIAKMTAVESGKGIVGLVTMATGIATIIANMANAIKVVKSAKFATGGLVTGPGTGTSDSIPAMLSNGESVMTARTTSMFAPILSSFNQMGGGVPISIAESSNQTLGEDMLARSIQKGMAGIRPVVSVEEITQVSNRVEVVETVGTL